MKDSKEPKISRILARTKETPTVKRNFQSIQKTLFPSQSKPKVQNFAGQNLNLAPVEKLQQFPGNFVVGVVGRAGAGKSTIISQLNAFRRDSDHSPTHGIDLLATSDGLLLLDTRPLSINRKKEVSKLLLVYLFSICDLVIIVADSADDDGLLKFVNTSVEMVDKLSEESGTMTTEKVELLFILNKQAHDSLSRNQITFESNIHSCITTENAIIKRHVGGIEILNYLVIPIKNPSPSKELVSSYHIAMEQFVKFVKGKVRPMLINGTKTKYAQSEKEWFRKTTNLRAALKKLEST